MSGTASIRTVTHCEPDEWNREHDAFFDRYEWNRVWHETWPENFIPRCLDVEMSDGTRYRIAGCERNLAKGILTEFVSPPGGAVSRSTQSDIPEAILDYLAKRYNGFSLSGIPNKPELATESGYEVRLLEADIDTIFQKSRGGQYARRAEKDGLTMVSEPEGELTDALLSIHARLLALWKQKGLHTTEYPERFIRQLIHSDTVRLNAVKDPDGTILAAGLFLESPPYVMSYFTIAHPEFRKKRAQEFYFFNRIFHYRALGYTIFDFGPSKQIEGVESFKEKFGASPYPIQTIQRMDILMRGITALDRIRS